MSKKEIESYIEQNKEKDVLHSFCPYRVCPLGAHVDHQKGLVTGFALDKGVSFDFYPTDDGIIEVYSQNYGGLAYGSTTEEHERDYTWGDFIFGAVHVLQQTYTLSKGFKGIISGTLPVGGLSSSASVILTYLSSIAKVNDIHLTASDIIQAAIEEERNYIGVNVGKLDQSCEVYCKKDSLMFLDTLTDKVQILPVNKNMKPFEIAIFFTGQERKLAGSAYNMRVDECKAASYALKDFAHLEYGKFCDSFLRDIPDGIYQQYKEKLPQNWRKRSDHYYSEIKRVKKGVKAWKEGNIEEFGELMFESGLSSINQYETGSPELKEMHKIMRKTEGIYGGRFSGAGFNGSAVALINPEKKELIKEFVTKEYLEKFPELKDSFGVYFCKTADGVSI